MNLSRTPQGVRGLKLANTEPLVAKGVSHSARSAWIETVIPWILGSVGSVALRKECVD